MKKNKELQELRRVSKTIFKQIEDIKVAVKTKEEKERFYKVCFALFCKQGIEDRGSDPKTAEYLLKLSEFISR